MKQKTLLTRVVKGRRGQFQPWGGSARERGLVLEALVVGEEEVIRRAPLLAEDMKRGLQWDRSRSHGVEGGIECKQKECVCESPLGGSRKAELTNGKGESVGTPVCMLISY